MGSTLDQKVESTRKARIIQKVKSSQEVQMTQKATIIQKVLPTQKIKRSFQNFRLIKK
jgi:tellurite resistance protein